MPPAETKMVAEEARTNAAASLRESSERWWLMVLLITGMVFCYAHRGALSVAAPFIRKDLNLSLATMGILLSAFSWSYSFMQMPAGWLVDRFGVKRAYALGYTFWSLASISTGLAKNLLTLIIPRVLLGVGQAVAFPASARAVANWFQDRERGTVTGSYLAGVRLGTALIAAIGGFFLAHYSWQLFFVITGLIPLVWLLPWMKFMGKWEGAAEAAGASTGKSISFAGGLALLKRRSVLGIFLGFFAYDYAWFVYFYWLPSYLREERGFSPKEMGIYSSVPYLAMSIIILLSGMMSDWLVRRGLVETRVRKTFIVIGLAVGCLIVPAGMTEDKMTAVWLLTISLCGLGIASPNTWTLTQAVCAKKIVGTVSGIQNFGGNLGGILAPWLTGVIAHATNSFALALGITGAVLVVGILAYWLLIVEKVEAE
jgi:MFS family permease